MCWDGVRCVQDVKMMVVECVEWGGCGSERVRRVGEGGGEQVGQRCERLNPF